MMDKVNPFLLIQTTDKTDKRFFRIIPKRKFFSQGFFVLGLSGQVLCIEVVGNVAIDLGFQMS